VAQVITDKVGHLDIFYATYWLRDSIEQNDFSIIDGLLIVLVRLSLVQLVDVIHMKTML
jgi:hypothetical protein